VAYVARVLQELAPNKYREIAVAAAKDLLANPPAIEKPTRLDEGARNYLYSVLSMYKDPSFAPIAQDYLVGDDGRIDRTSLEYLTSTMKGDSVPALYQALRDDRVTNLWERAALTAQISNYAGTNPQADDIFKGLVNDQSLPLWLRASAIQGLVGGRSQSPNQQTADPAQIKARIVLLNSLDEFQDERLARVQQEVLRKLSERLDGTQDDRELQSFRKRLDRAQGQPEMPPLPGADR
jgi:hypothetical protein